ncbi:unnamed protein product, partial [Rotaria sp. Silwood1]
MVLRKLEPEQIVSLRLNSPWYQTLSELDSLNIFTNVTSLTLINLQQINAVNNYATCFPRLIRLSL